MVSEALFGHRHVHARRSRVEPGALFDEFRELILYEPRVRLLIKGVGVVYCAFVKRI